ncbi:SiaB family protein kinase [Roseospirillum parvum]|uniref:Uncharacterized protein n=1 Tax=Roseospirillum parvum TaxID=83401 RepID=A0A1G7X286_9PROT|nr:SiaB family protein kinase [Roseospirillum parvum]SDG78308.1 hypothetical protein SAMN05421742_102406 [Roseospirillum parvum]
MLAQEQYAFREVLTRKGILFCYSGYLTEDILTGIGEAIQKKLEMEQASRQTSKSLFAVFVEQVQNIIRYSAERETQNNGDDTVNELSFGVLSVGHHGGRYFVSCCNLVRTDDTARLKTSLEHIQSLDRGALISLYKQTLKNGRPEGSKGAGVGFIDIARHATQGFAFDFMKIDDTHTYFCLEAYV